jgi:Flp pilus assembly protein TadG
MLYPREAFHGPPRGLQGVKVTMPSARVSERGQTIVLLVVFMFVLLGFCALAIDVGLWYQDKRAVQADADAAALAGASVLPAGWGTAQSTATTEFNSNKVNGDVASYQNTTNLVSNDSITVTVTRSAPSFFAHLLGKNNVTIQASARATVESPNYVGPNNNVMPWAVMQNDYQLGGSYPIYTDNSHNANNGAVSLPYQSGPNCPTPNGANPYEEEITGQLQPCGIAVNQTIDVKSGNNTGPTAQGLNVRITNWMPFNQIVTNISGNTYEIAQGQDNNPQLVLIPVVTALDGTTSWPSGSSAQIKVVGFAWFVIESCGPVTNPSYCKNSDGGEVNGRFVNIQDSDPTTGLGGYTPGSNTDYQVELTQ